MKKLLVLMMSIIMVLAFTACDDVIDDDNFENGGAANPTVSGDAANSGNSGAAVTDGGDPAQGEISVFIEIDYPDGSGVRDIDDVKINVPNGSSALDVLNLYAEANGFKVLMDESSPTAYVISINGVDATDSAGWIYELNDQSIMEQASDVIVAQGDEVSWSFENWNDMD